MYYVSWTEKTYKESFLSMSFESNTSTIIPHENYLEKFPSKQTSLKNYI